MIISKLNRVVYEGQTAVTHTHHNGKSAGQMIMYSPCSPLFVVYFRISEMMDISIIQFEGVSHLLRQNLGSTEIHCKKDTLQEKLILKALQ